MLLLVLVTGLAGCGGHASGTPHRVDRFGISYPQFQTPVITNASGPGAWSVGDVLSTTNGAWINSPTSFSYQWQDCDATGASCANIRSATSSAYTIQVSDGGDTIRAVVVAHNPGGSASATSGPTGVVGNSAIFPLSLAVSNRTLQTAGGQPFLMVGDSPQSLIGLNSVASAESFIDDRAAHGFNTLWVNLLCTTYTFCNADGKIYNNANSTPDNLAPFSSGTSPSNYDLSTPSSTYFAQTHTIVAYAKTKNIAMMLDPIETGGWLATLQGNGNGASNQSGSCPGTGTKDYCYGVYVANTFADLSNVIWIHGNDFESWRTTVDNNDALAVAAGIKSVDANAVQSIELDFTSPPTSYSSASLDDTAWTSVLGFNSGYTYAPTYGELLYEYSQSPTIPAILQESNYEAEQNGAVDGCLSNAIRNCRLQEWWTMTSGATGQLYGSHFTDSIANGWLTSDIDTTAVTQLGYETTFLHSIPWQNLVPDDPTAPAGSHTFLTAGFGTYASTGLFAANTYATAELSTDGKTGLIYMPTSRAVTVDMSKMTGTSVTARWYDPTSGTFSTVTGSPFTLASHVLPAPGNNSAGDSDWALLLQS